MPRPLLLPQLLLLLSLRFTSSTPAEKELEHAADADAASTQLSVVHARAGTLVVGGKFVLVERLAQTKAMLAITDSKPSELAVKPHPIKSSRALYDYELRRQFGKGGFGEVWAAVRVSVDPQRAPPPPGQSPHLAHYSLPGGDIDFNLLEESTMFVLKRFIAGEARRESALREVHFGRLLRGLEYISRFEEAFEEEGELWLVFQHEGVSLYSLLYQSVQGTTNTSSQFWREMKDDIEVAGSDNMTTMQEIIFQLLSALQECHSRNILHRDIKPGNIMLKHSSLPGRVMPGRRKPAMKAGYLSLIDFGSAVDDVSLKSLYPNFGPMQTDETLQYAPPEVLFSYSPYALKAPTSYDMWSVGVLMLEFIIGSSDAFKVDRRTRAILEQRLTDESEDIRERAHTFRALFEYCIYRPEVHGYVQQYKRLSNFQACNEEDFQKLLKKWDPTGIGAPSIWCLRLIRRLLVWDPLQRISASDALKHAWFHGPYRCPNCGEEFEIPHDLEVHNCTFRRPTTA